MSEHNAFIPVTQDAVHDRKSVSNEFSESYRLALWRYGFLGKAPVNPYRSILALLRHRTVSQQPLPECHRHPALLCPGECQYILGPDECAHEMGEDRP